MLLCSRNTFAFLGHWQNKRYPYSPYQDRTLGDGILLSYDMSTEYWWCWVGLGVNLAYIFFLNALIMLCLAFLPSYGSNSTVAKTAEELDDRRAALFGDEGRDANDIVVNVTNGFDNEAVEHSNGAVTEMIQVTCVDCIAEAVHRWQQTVQLFHLALISLHEA